MPQALVMISMRGQVAHKHGADMLRQTQRDRLFQGHFCVGLDTPTLRASTSFKCSTLLKS